MPDRFTVVGSRGFLGGALVASLRANGDDVAEARHDDDLSDRRDLGHVVYCSGIAASGAADPAYAFAVHVDAFRRLAAQTNWISLLYVSTTRVYGVSPRTDEDAPLALRPVGGGDLYRATKVAGETAALADPRPALRVARLSNVVGESFRSPLFVSDLLRQAAVGGPVRVRTSRRSSKDYVVVDDVCRYLAAIARSGAQRVYNVAAGTNVENGAIFDVLTRARVAVEIAPDAVDAIAPPIDARRLQAEFGPPRSSLLDVLPGLIEAFARCALAEPR